jgi:hypothetical protein
MTTWRIDVAARRSARGSCVHPRSAHVHEGIDRTYECPKNGEHQVHRSWILSFDAGHEDSEDTHCDRAANQQSAQQGMGSTQHHDRNEREPLQGLEPGESMACTPVPGSLGPRASLLECTRLRMSRQGARTISQIVHASRLRYAHGYSHPDKMTMGHPECDRIATHRCASKSRHTLLDVSTVATPTQPQCTPRAIDFTHVCP